MKRNLQIFLGTIFLKKMFCMELKALWGSKNPSLTTIINIKFFIDTQLIWSNYSIRLTWFLNRLRQKYIYLNKEFLISANAYLNINIFALIIKW